MNADRNWERYQPGERESRGGSQAGFQFSDAYGPGGAEGNRIINDIHCKNATFDQQGFPDSAQLLPDEQGGGNGPEGGHHGHRGPGRGGREEFDPRGQEGPGNGPGNGDGLSNGDGDQWAQGGPGGPGGSGDQGRWQHGGQRWQHGGHSRRGHHGHHGGAQAETQNQDFDANGNPLPGTVEASEMGMNTIVPRDANGNPIYSTLSQPSGQPVDYSAPAAVTPQSDASNPVTAGITDASSLAQASTSGATSATAAAV